MKPPADVLRLAADCECMTSAVERIWRLVSPAAGLPPAKRAERSEGDS